jgi:hypothetical protein
MGHTTVTQVLEGLVGALDEDSYVLYQENLSVDTAVVTAWNYYLEQPLPALRRWFSRSLEAIQSEPLDFKISWLDIVKSIRELCS